MPRNIGRRKFERTCIVDGKVFKATRHDALFCSSTCRSRRSRQLAAQQDQRDAAVELVNVIITRAQNWRAGPDLVRELADVATLSKIEILCRQALLEMAVQTRIELVDVDGRLEVGD